MLIEIAIADAFGAPFEFDSKERIMREFDFGQYAKHGLSSFRLGKKERGIYTDDTQMSIAIANHMLNGSPMTHEEYAGYFYNQYKEDKRDGFRFGFSKRMRDGLERDSIESFIEYCAGLNTRNSNGCVMRAVPLGLYPDVDTVKKAAILQASLTHPTLECLIATQAIALTAHYFYHNLHLTNVHFPWWIGEKLGIGEWHHVELAWKKGEVECDALMTASFCINNTLYEFNMRNALENAIKVGGDVDSTAAISLGLLSLKEQHVNDLDQNLYDMLENGKFGRDYIIKLDQELLNKYPRNK